MVEQNTLIHDFNSQKDKNLTWRILADKWSIAFIVSVVIFGVFSGYVLTTRSSTQITEEGKAEGFIVKTEKVVGSQDKKTFKDSAEGFLEKGGINGEGTHRLIREGGPSQTAYLTSSVVDMDEFVGKKVKVWGETFGAEKAGWLMDVGRVEVLE